MRCRWSLLAADGCCCCCHRCCHRCCQPRPGRLCPPAPAVRLVTPATVSVEGVAPYPGQARCLALDFWPECCRRLNVKGGQRPFPEETRSALDIEGKHVTVRGPSPDLTSSWHQFRQSLSHGVLVSRFLILAGAGHQLLFEKVSVIVAVGRVPGPVCLWSVIGHWHGF